MHSLFPISQLSVQFIRIPFRMNKLQSNTPKREYFFGVRYYNSFKELLQISK